MAGRSRGQRLASGLQLPHRPAAGPGVPGAWFDVAFVLTVSPLAGHVLGLLLVGVAPLIAAPLLAVLLVAHGLWLASFPS